MNANLNNEEYPRLSPPEVVYEHKASLKKPVLVPLYAKVTAAAAAVVLLFGLFWTRSLTPEQDLVAELKPIEANHIDSNQIDSYETLTLAESQARFVVPKKIAKLSSTRLEKPVTNKRAEAPMLAELQPKAAPALINNEFQSDEPLASDIYYAFSETSIPQQEENYDSDLSLVRRGIYRITEGEHDSFSSIIGEGLQTVKGEMASFAMTLQSSRSQLRQMVR
jgi:hypothetical protein